MISIQIIDASKQEEIIDSIKDILAESDWVRPIASLFVVACDTEDEKDEIRDNMNKLANNNLQDLRFIISPIIHGGSLNGFANEKVWPALKTITQAQATFF